MKLSDFHHYIGTCTCRQHTFRWTVLISLFVFLLCISTIHANNPSSDEKSDDSDKETSNANIQGMKNDNIPQVDETIIDSPDNQRKNPILNEKNNEQKVIINNENFEHNKENVKIDNIIAENLNIENNRKEKTNFEKNNDFVKENKNDYVVVNDKKTENKDIVEDKIQQPVPSHIHGTENQIKEKNVENKQDDILTENIKKPGPTEQIHKNDKEELDPHAQQLPSSEKGEGFQSGAIGSNIQSDKEGGSQEDKKQTETSQDILTDNKQLDPSQSKLPSENKKIEEVETKTNFDATKTEEEFQKWLDERVVKVETEKEEVKLKSPVTKSDEPIVQKEESSDSTGKFAGSSSSTNIVSDLSSTSNFNPSTSTRISSSKHVQNDQHANTINDLSSNPLYKEIQIEKIEEKTEMDAVNSEDLSMKEILNENGFWSSQMRESVEVEKKKDDRPSTSRGGKDVVEILQNDDDDDEDRHDRFTGESEITNDEVFVQGDSQQEESLRRLNENLLKQLNPKVYEQLKPQFEKQFQQVMQKLKQAKLGEKDLMGKTKTKGEMYTKGKLHDNDNQERQIKYTGNKVKESYNQQPDDEQGQKQEAVDKWSDLIKQNPSNDQKDIGDTQNTGDWWNTVREEPLYDLTDGKEEYIKNFYKEKYPDSYTQPRKHVIEDFPLIINEKRLNMNIVDKISRSFNGIQKKEAIVYKPNKEGTIRAQVYLMTIEPSGEISVDVKQYFQPYVPPKLISQNRKLEDVEEMSVEGEVLIINRSKSQPYTNISLWRIHTRYTCTIQVIPSLK